MIINGDIIMELTVDNIDNIEFTKTDIASALQDAGDYGMGFMVSGKWQWWMKKCIDGYMSKHRRYTWENIKDTLHCLNREDIKEDMKEALIQHKKDLQAIQEEIEKRKAEGNYKTIKL